ncbi:MAG TPA: peptidoglycan-associated lipoprotein Pal [Desulfuromonadaceae bacterium]
MKRGMLTLCAVLGMTALVAVGCAKKEVVKTEEPVKAPTVAPAPQPAPPKVEAPKAEEPKVEAPKPVEAQAAKASEAVSFESVYFDFDKSDLRQDARDVLNKNAAALKADAGIKIKIEGNCDERGSAEYNLALGERRAKSAMQYLITLGIPADRLSVISYGKEKAHVDANSEAVWSKDRRDDFVIVK